MAWAKTAFGDMTDAEVKAELRRHYDANGNRLVEVDNEEAFERSIAIDAELNVLTFRLWQENVAGLRRLGYAAEADRYELDGPTVFGMSRFEHPARTRMVPRSEAAIKHHDAQQTSPGRRRLCGAVLRIK